jgi:hypothetical protein
MGVILFIGKQFIPQGAQEIINFAKGIAGTVMTRGLSPIGKSLKERTLPLAKEELAQSERVRDIAKRLATAGNPRAKIAAPIWALGRSMGRAGLGTMEDTKNNVSRLKAQAEKIETPEMLLSKYLSARTKSERLAYLSTAIKKGKPFKKVFEKILDPKDVQDIKKRQKNDPTVKLTAEEKQRVKNFDDFKNQTIATTKMANDIGSIPDAERIMRAFLHLEEGRKNKDDLIGKMGFKPLEGNDIKKYDGSLSEKYIAEAKGDEIKDFNKNLWKMTEAQEAILKHWTGEKVGSAGREFHDDFLDAFRGMFKKEEDGGLHDAINILNGNKNIYNYLSSSPAQGLGLSMKEINPELEKTSKEKVEIYSGSEEDFRAAKKDRDDREALKNKERNK